MHGFFFSYLPNQYRRLYVLDSWNRILEQKSKGQSEMLTSTSSNPVPFQYAHMEIFVWGLHREEVFIKIWKQLIKKYFPPVVSRKELRNWNLCNIGFPSKLNNIECIIYNLIVFTSIWETVANHSISIINFCYLKGIAGVEDTEQIL